MDLQQATASLLIALSRHKRIADTILGMPFGSQCRDGIHYTVSFDAVRRLAVPRRIFKKNYLKITIMKNINRKTFIQTTSLAATEMFITPGFMSQQNTPKIKSSCV
jgi:hypothetical protein